MIASLSLEKGQTQKEEESGTEEEKILLVSLTSSVHFCGCCRSSQIIVASVKGVLVTFTQIYR